MSSSFPLVEDLEIWLHNIRGERAMMITDATDVKTEVQLQGIEEFSFRIRRDDPKSAFIIADQLVEYDGARYRVRDYEDEHPTMRTVVCDANWIELTWRTKTGLYSLLSKTPAEGLTSILLGTQWIPGVPPVNLTLFSAEDTDPTNLAILRRWASVTGYELQFDTIAKTVTMVTQVGVNRGVGFTYGHNLKTFKRKYRPPQATRLYPYGANDLDISSVNPAGVPFVENYSWYTAQG